MGAMVAWRGERERERREGAGEADARGVCGGVAVCVRRARVE